MHSALFEDFDCQTRMMTRRIVSLLPVVVIDFVSLVDHHLARYTPHYHSL
jgi:hypothetical protein